MQVYRVEFSGSDEEYPSGVYTARIPYGIGDKAADTFHYLTNLHMTNIDHKSKPNPFMEHICNDYMPYVHFCACKNLEDLFFVWFEGKSWVIEQMLKVFTLAVYEVKEEYVKQGKAQLVFDRSEASLVSSISYEELMDYIQKLNSTYVDPYKEEKVEIEWQKPLKL